MFLSNTMIDARDGIHSANEDTGMRPNDSMNAAKKWFATAFAVLGCTLMIAVADRGAEAAMSTSGGGSGSKPPVRQNPVNPLFGETADPDCRCDATFSGVGAIEVTSCDELSTAWCGEEMSLPDPLGSADFEGCECTCLDGYELTAKSVSRSDEDGFFVRGVPDFWQFRHGCDKGSRANMVGCGPVAMAEILYWYGSRGFPELVDNHEMSDVTTSVIYEIMLDTLAAQGISEPGTWHAWKTLTTELRDDYVKGLCMSAAVTGGQGLYATTENGFMDGLSQYASDRGVTLDVDGFKIDRDNSNYGLNLIKRELKAGRPLVMRFNSDRSFRSFFTDNETGEDIFSGELSYGSWFNDHYAVVTGFRKTSTGRDVLYLNQGAGSLISAETASVTEAGQAADADFSGTDTPVEWNPAGKWVRLYTVEVADEPSGSSNCESSLTRVEDPRYFPRSFDREDGITTVLGFSHEDLHSTYTEFSGTASKELDDCGSVLDYEEVYEPTWSHEELVCPNEAASGLDPEDSPSGIGDRLGP